VDEAVALPEAKSSPQPDLLPHIIPLASAAARVLPIATLTEEGTTRARHGKRLQDSDFVARPGDAACAWLDAGGRLVAIGALDPDEGLFRVVRGFRGA
jgi:hypothetical protein